MYPHEFLSLFPPYPRSNRAFVAMSFSEDHRARWENIISPGISRIEVNGKLLEPYRIDLGKNGDSLQTEILKEISNSRIVVGDLSTIGQLNGYSVRNANVLYEIGIAHASRLPEEVVLFRSDDDPLLFDITNIRIHKYDLSEPENSKKIVADAILNSLKEVNLKQSLAVTKAISQLDYQAWTLLAESRIGPIPHPTIRTMGEALSGSRRVDSINKLLELGMLEVQFQKITLEQIQADANKPAEDLFNYTLTPFGASVFERATDKFGYTIEDLDQILKTIGA
jgi:hypothetical protein